jgi:hypothetical protein
MGGDVLLPGTPLGIAAESGVTAGFLGSPRPGCDTLVLETAGSLPPGTYPLRVTARLDGQLAASVPATLTVASCVELEPGEFTQAISSNLVPLITAGKPSIEHGLLVPLQVCAGTEPRRLQVSLERALSEAGTTMATPPRFYIYRSLVWPAPEAIQTHNYWAANAAERVDAAGWELERGVMPGLYMLVFERDRYGSSTDAGDIPAAVTYRVALMSPDE